MGSIFSGWTWKFPDRRGSISLMMAGTAIPLVIAIGVGIDIARLALAQVSMQAAVDGAALAGATVYTTTAANGAAQTVSQAYFDHYIQGATVTNVTRVATAQPGTTGNGSSSLNVAMAATGTMPTTFMQVAGFSTMTITAHAVAGQPAAQPKPPAAGIPIGTNTSSASDWNSAYMYPIPMDANGTVHYDQLPTADQFYQIGNNCRGSVDTSWSTNSPCNGRYGADWTGSTGTPPTYLQNQPIGFVLVNQTGGVMPYSSGEEHSGKNFYGSPNNNYAVFETALLSLAKPPSLMADSQSTKSILNSYVYPSGRSIGQPDNANTNYYSVTNNCSLLIQAYDTSKPLPSGPPQSGSCYQLSDTTTGYQFANLSCAQINGRTFIYWWNDMGGLNYDDRNYNDLSFQFSCTPSGGTPGAKATATAVALIQ